MGPRFLGLGLRGEGPWFRRADKVRDTRPAVRLRIGEGPRLGRVGEGPRLKRAW